MGKNQRRAAHEGRAPYDGLPWLTEEELLATPGLEAVAIETEVRKHDIEDFAFRGIICGKPFRRQILRKFENYDGIFGLFLAPEELDFDLCASFLA